MPRKVERRKALVYSSISTSREVSNLTLRAALFFTWLLPSLDDQGRILVDSKLLKAVVVPMMDDITARRIPKLLAELEAQSLIHLYRPEGVNGEVIQVKSWWDFQALRVPQASQYPPPAGWHDRVAGSQPRDGGSGKFIKRDRAIEREVLTKLRRLEDDTANFIPTLQGIAGVLPYPRKALMEALVALHHDGKVRAFGDQEETPPFDDPEIEFAVTE